MRRNAFVPMLAAFFVRTRVRRDALRDFGKRYFEVYEIMRKDNAYR